ncbi:MAG: hypothetical protein KIS91_01570 [Anaerolineae bacterium]|nr:hypothetical protein [Anaerolineae bacterium]
MKVKLEKLAVVSRRELEMIDITDLMEGVVRDSGVTNGLVNVINQLTRRRTLS